MAKTPNNDAKNDIAKQVDQLQNSMCELSDRIHSHPELALKEYEAVKWLTSELQEHGFTVEIGVGGLETAFRAAYEGASQKPVACLVVEYDALPELGHACGHNVSGVASVAAAIALSKVMSKYQLQGSIVVVGTPAEEYYAGKVTLIEAGVFEDVDFAMMVHMYDRNEASPVFLALDALTFTFKGKPAHAAGAPHEGINALNAVRLTFAGIDALRQHVREEVRIHGIVTEGGDAANIVPEKASANVYVRARERRYLDEVKEKVKNCARGAAIATGAELEIGSFEQSNDNLITNPVLIELFRKSWKNFVSEIHETGPTVGSTDMGNVSHVVPSIHPMVAMAPKGTVLHTREFADAARSEKAYEALSIASKTMGMTVVDVLTNSAVVDELRLDTDR